MEKFEIKPALEKDVPLILSFIRDLAAYENLLDEVKATEDELSKSLFGKKRGAEVIIGYAGSTPVCFALFSHNYSTFLGKPGIYLEDLYVKPEFRGNGYGKKLLGYLAKLALDQDCGRLEWWVLGWNKPAINFYQNLGARPMTDWTVYRVDGINLALLAKSYEP